MLLFVTICSSDCRNVHNEGDCFINSSETLQFKQQSPLLQEHLCVAMQSIDSIKYFSLFEKEVFSYQDQRNWILYLIYLINLFFGTFISIIYYLKRFNHARKPSQYPIVFNVN